MALKCVAVCISLFNVFALRVENEDVEDDNIEFSPKPEGFAKSLIEVAKNASGSFDHVDVEVKRNASGTASAVPMTPADILCRGGLAGKRRYRNAMGGVDLIDERPLLEAMAPLFHQNLAVIDPRGNGGEDRMMINQMMQQAFGGGGNLLEHWTPQQAFITFSIHKDQLSEAFEVTWVRRYTTWAEEHGLDPDAHQNEEAFVVEDKEANGALLPLFLQDVREPIIRGLERLFDTHRGHLTHMIDWMDVAEAVRNGHTFSEYVSQANPAETQAQADGTVTFAGPQRFIEMDSVYLDRWRRAWVACPSPLRCPVGNICPVPNSYQPAFSPAEVAGLQAVQTNVAWQAIDPNSLECKWRLRAIIACSKLKRF